MSTIPATDPLSLLAIPQEILDIITEDLPYASNLALRYSCRKLYTIVKPYSRLSKLKETTRGRDYDMVDLLEIEKWPCYNYSGYTTETIGQPMATLDYFACRLCLRIRSAGMFSDKMMKDMRGKQSPKGNEAAHCRFCIPCGIESGRYQKGIRLQYGGARIDGGVFRMICFGCGRLEIEAEKRLCQTCLDGMK